MAAALGARVYPGPVKEIGWATVERAYDSTEVPGLADYLDTVCAVMHWHGDTFDLPPWSRRLASNTQYRNQAFGWGKQCLGIQFHPEFHPANLERWLIGHALEISKVAGLSTSALRNDTLKCGAQARDAADRFFRRWIASLEGKKEAAKTFSLRVTPPRCLRHF